MEKSQEITELILKARAAAYAETSAEPEPDLTQPIQWPVQCTVGPGLEGAIACETQIGYVNGTKGWLIYRGYDIFDLCAYATFEEVSYLLLHGTLPTKKQLEKYKRRLTEYRHVPNTLRVLMSFPVQDINPMAALRIGTMMMRQRLTWRDLDEAAPDLHESAIGTDEDSIPQEFAPYGEPKAVYEFKRKKKDPKPATARPVMDDAASMDSCYHLIAAMETITAAVSRLRQRHLPIEPREDLSHAANLLYMFTGREPTPVEERVMDVALILHADHGMNASTFASMVVASTLSDIYFSVGAGIAALNGPLHGGANEQVLHMLRTIGSPDKVQSWYKDARARKEKVMGFGHRVYKAYDPRARILGPLAEHLVQGSPEQENLFDTAKALETTVIEHLGKEKKIFPNVDFYSGIVYSALGIPAELFTPIFAVSRVSGWVARVKEYLKSNRIFRPRAMYTGRFDEPFVPIDQRKKRGGTQTGVDIEDGR